MRKAYIVYAVIVSLFIFSYNEETIIADVGTKIWNSPQLNKQSTDGLLSTPDSISYTLGIVQQHNHANERWYEQGSVVTASSPADRGSYGAGSFRIDAGNNDWSDWVRILGTSDTPADAGNVYFDFHRIQITAAERTTEYWFQVAFGASATDAVADGIYTEFPFKPQSVQGKASSVDIASCRHLTRTQVFARVKNPGQNTATIDFVVGIHEYEG